MASPFALSIEQEALRSLRPLFLDVYATENVEAARKLPGMAYRIANEASAKQSEELLKNALSIWRLQLVLLPEHGQNRVRKAVSDLIAEMAYYVIRNFEEQLENEYSSEAVRLAALPQLDALARFEAEALKLHFDCRDQGAFDAAYRRWSDAWFQHWHPEDELDDLKLFSDTGDRKYAQRLERAQTLSDAKARATHSHLRSMCELSAWVVSQYRRELIDFEESQFFIDRLIGAFDSRTTVVDEILEFASSDSELPLLSTWDFPEFDRAGTAVSVSWVRDRDLYRFWLSILLARFSGAEPEDNEPALGIPVWLPSEMKSDLNTIGSEWERWSHFIGSDANLLRARAWLELQETRTRGEIKTRIENAPIDPTRVAEFTQTQLEGFAKEALIRGRVIAAGAAQVKTDDQAPSALRPMPVRRDVFLEIGPVVSGFDVFGRGLGELVDAAIYKAIQTAKTSEQAAEQPLDSVIEAIAQLKKDGKEPDAVLIPGRRQARLVLSGHPRFRWRRTDIRESASAVGTIDDCPVYFVNGVDSDEIVVVDFNAAIRLTETRPVGSTAPFAVQVRDFSQERAEELVGSGFSFSDKPEMAKDAIVESLVKNFADVHVSYAYEIDVLDGAALGIASFRVPALSADRDGE